MPAPILRHYAQGTPTASLGTLVTLVTVPPSRVLAVSKVVVTNATTGTVKFNLISANFYLAASVSLAAGQVYTETGLVALAGETIQVSCDTANGVQAHVFGEEVDA